MDTVGTFICVSCHHPVRVSFTLLLSWGTLLTLAKCAWCYKHLGDNRSLHAMSEIPACIGQQAEQDGLFTIIMKRKDGP